MPSIVLITPEELRALFRSEIEAALRTIVKESQPNEELLTRNETAALLRVTLPTIHAWMQRSILPFYKMGSRTYFKKNEVMASLSSASLRKKFSGKRPS